MQFIWPPMAFCDPAQCSPRSRVTEFLSVVVKGTNTGRPSLALHLSASRPHQSSQEPASVSGVLTSLLQTVAVKQSCLQKCVRKESSKSSGGWKSPGPDPSLVPGRFSRGSARGRRKKYPGGGEAGGRPRPKREARRPGRGGRRPGKRPGAMVVEPRATGSRGRNK